jgi:CBS domain-containing protein
MNIRQMKAAELMSRDVLTIEAAEPLRAAAQRMNDKRVHCLIVPAPEPGACVGIVTMKDIVQVLCDGEVGVLDQLLVADAMSTPAISVQQEFSIADCLRLMRVAGVRSVPVLDGVRLVGLLSFTDVLRAVALEGRGAPPA